MVELHHQAALDVTRNREAGARVTLPLWPAWVSDALCAEVDLDIFFPGKGGSSREARSICARCTVAAECLDFALQAETHLTAHGIFGGTTPAERRKLHRLAGGTPPPGEVDDDLDETA